MHNIMINKQKVLDEFKQLGYTEKKQKLLDLFVLFETSSQVIQDTKPLLIADKLSGEQISTYYEYLVEIISNLNEEDLVKSIQWLEKIHQTLLAIQHREEQERNEENPESLLQNI